MVETLAFQAEARLTDLMWEPVRTARAVQAVVAEVQPDAIIVDHLAFSARLGAGRGAASRYADVVLGHPVRAARRRRGLRLPARVAGRVHARCRPSSPRCASCASASSASFTAEWNAALAELDPTAPPSPSAFAEHGDLLLLNYPGELSRPARALPPHVFLGSAVRDEAVDAEVEAWLASSDEPFVYVSFGSFLSVRADVLARVADALASLGLRAAIAIGSADRADSATLPDGWLVREFLPQVRLLGSRRGRRHARRQQQRHRGDDRRGAAASCCRSRPTSSPVRRPSSAPASASRSPRTTATRRRARGTRSAARARRSPSRSRDRPALQTPGARTRLLRGRRRAEPSPRGSRATLAVALHQGGVGVVLRPLAQLRLVVQRVDGALGGAEAARRAASRGRRTRRHPRSPSRGSARPARRGSTRSRAS